MGMVRCKVLGEKVMVYRERRVGQGPYSRDSATCDLPRHESYFCRRPSMFVIIFRFYVPFSGLC
jgi:hypothetical protein